MSTRANPVDNNGTCDVTTSKVCNRILLHCWELGLGITPSRLELLLYFACGWHIGITEKALLRESILSTVGGPMVGSLRTYFSSWDDSYVADLIRPALRNSGGIDVDAAAILDEESHSILGKVCWAFRKTSAEHMLKNATANSGAWSVSRVGLGDDRISIIHPEILKVEFTDLAKRLGGRGKPN